MLKHITFLATFLLASSAYASEQRQCGTLAAKSHCQQDTLTLESFKDAPNDIDGCGSSFSTSKKALDKMAYIFISSYDGVAYIKVGGKLIRLKLLKTNRRKETFFGNSISEVYQGSGFKVTVSTKEIKQQDGEVWIHKGYILVERGVKAKSKISVIGETGC